MCSGRKIGIGIEIYEIKTQIGYTDCHTLYILYISLPRIMFLIIYLHNWSYPKLEFKEQHDKLQQTLLLV